jgi:hypothetical protein
MPNDFESLKALAERRPKPPNPLKIGKRNITAAWPVMQTAKYVDETNAYIDSLLARLSVQEEALQKIEDLDSCPFSHGACEVHAARRIARAALEKP